MSSQKQNVKTAQLTQEKRARKNEKRLIREAKEVKSASIDKILKQGKSEGKTYDEIFKNARFDQNTIDEIIKNEKFLQKTKKQQKQSLKDRAIAKKMKNITNLKSVPVNYKTLFNPIRGYYVGTIKQLKSNMELKTDIFPNFKNQLDSLKNQYYTKINDYSISDLVTTNFNNKMSKLFNECEDILMTEEKYNEFVDSKQ